MGISMTVIKCGSTTCTDKRVGVLAFQQVWMCARVCVCVSFRCNQMRRKQRKKKKEWERGQTNIALKQVQPWTCYFPRGETQQRGMNSIITCTHTKALAQVHLGTQADREEHKHKHLSCQASTQEYTQTQSIIHWIKSGKEVKLKEDNLLSLYCVFVQSCIQTPWGACTQTTKVSCWENERGRQQSCNAAQEI